ncbi:hypothetical protein ACVMB3_003085 [Sinorhizobium meliloti]|jgi:hypothetical protein|nr:hypothetical protein SinmeB_0874 [Sinorhizobium meliloti BL225C]AGA06220.1 hypothetical protein C770_GR4Chr1260 [Sinorhizobium meliloti GR4]MBP2467740.1 hypothetical protein [Sinorhizobium meliloti]TWA97995.1 hypothetical protein FB000_11291 [Ensifer sp. SEMIA 134]TWB33513.1 hypothetical protein FB001_11280 [Ensifer sp. SEMIA 135]
MPPKSVQRFWDNDMHDNDLQRGALYVLGLRRA